MKRLKYLCMGILFFCTSLLADGRFVFAADEEYTYTVRLYAGNLGTLSAEGIDVSSASAKIAFDKDCVVITGLKYADTVYMNPKETAGVTDERYYVRGVRRAGRDNSEAEVPTFQVAADRDYVVAYGIKGDMAAYTVNYQDMEGNTLKKSDTYYGNIGERQYVSSRYIEGYEPQTLNLVKTLSANETENVFTFRYRPVTVASAPAENPAASDSERPAAASSSTTTGTNLTGGNTNTGNTVNEDAEEDAENAEEEIQEENPDEEEALGGDAEPLENVPDNEVPLGQQSLEDLDDGETPLADLKLDQAGLMGYFPVYLGIGITAAMILLIAGIFLYRKQKKPKAVKSKSAINSEADRSERKV